MRAAPSSLQPGEGQGSSGGGAVGAAMSAFEEHRASCLQASNGYLALCAEFRPCGWFLLLSCSSMSLHCVCATVSSTLGGAGSEKNWRSVVVTCGNNPEVKAWLLDYSRSELLVCVCVRVCVRVCHLCTP